MSPLSNRPQNKSFGERVGKVQGIKKHHKHVRTYNLQPTICTFCDSILPYNQRKNKFCSRSCAALYNNQFRIHSLESRNKTSNTLTGRKRSQEFKDKISFSLKRHNLIKRGGVLLSKTQQKMSTVIHRVKKPFRFNYKNFPPSVAGPYTQVYFNKCACCNKITVNQRKQKYCYEHQQYHSDIRAKYRFRFNVYEYPELFDLNLLNEVGWYAPGGRAGKWNINGLSRDHKVSVSDAIKHNYDPYYITHPLNCNLITHKANNIKKHRSSITYDELIEMVRWEGVEPPMGPFGTNSFTN